MRGSGGEKVQSRHTGSKGESEKGISRPREAIKTQRVVDVPMNTAYLSQGFIIVPLTAERPHRSHQFGGPSIVKATALVHGA